jgi:hypothetical protein
MSAPTEGTQRPVEEPVSSAAVRLIDARCGLPPEVGAEIVDVLRSAGLLVEPTWADDIRTQCTAEHVAELDALREQVRDLTDQRDGARRTVEDQQREYAAARLPRRDACRERCAEAGLARCCLTSGHTGAHETDWSGGQHVSWGGAA